MINSAQIRAGRALLGLSQSELAAAAGVGLTTIKRMELMTGGLRGNVQTISSIQRALEAAGVIFIDENETHGPGVQLRKPLP